MALGSGPTRQANRTSCTCQGAIASARGSNLSGGTFSIGRSRHWIRLVLMATVFCEQFTQYFLIRRFGFVAFS
ncbi:hypothetical protein B9Y82_10655 [Stenotrophomonas maltophilia]|nr:hypothetical protein B9Y82_10655 [Stenotrophomonas maltophilia]